VSNKNSPKRWTIWLVEKNVLGPSQTHVLTIKRITWAVILVCSVEKGSKRDKSLSHEKICAQTGLTSLYGAIYRNKNNIAHAE